MSTRAREESPERRSELAAGARLGPYEVVSLLGTGGTGEVWRAWDSRLSREVAIKVLSAQLSSDPSRLKRFEKEARAASALNHPNIVTIYDIGTCGSVSWIAMERVEGKTLREVLFSGPLPAKRLLDLAAQVAGGLARAHEAGIVHRDLKPENVMVTKDGLVKILDFGLAKLTEKRPDNEEGSHLPTETGTSPGVVLGTVGYMSPEQAGGNLVDYRSDQFSFGSILYEMATGKRAFQKPTAVDTLSAILHEEPRPVAEISPQAPTPLRWIVERCLVKEPDGRYASTLDLARELATLRDRLSETSAAVVPLSAPRKRARSLAVLVALLAALAILAGGLLLGRRMAESPPPSYHVVTYRSGFLTTARFAPDGQTVLYSGALGGDPMQGFLKRPESFDSVPFGPLGAAVLAVSPSGEVAVALDCRKSPFRRCKGTLAKLPLAGGAPREIYENVQQADWSPDGSTLAVASEAQNKSRLESPPGKVLYETTGYVSEPRFSPGGDAIAFFDHPQAGNDLGSVAVVDLSGKKRTLTGVLEVAGGIAWSPSGKEILFSANAGDAIIAIYAVTLSGKRRLIARAPVSLRLHDVFRDGRALVSEDSWEQRVFALAAGETRERDLSWLSWSFPVSLSPDGRTLLFSEQEPVYQACLRRTDGSPVVRLGEGFPYSLSPDGKWALVRQYPRIGETTPRLAPYVLIPTGVGEPRQIVYEGIEEYRCCAGFMPDGQEILFAGRRGKEFRFYRGSLDGGMPRPATPPTEPGFLAISSDGRRLLARSNGVPAVFSLDAGPEAPPRPIPGTTADDKPIVWSDDGRSVYLQNSGGVFRVDVETGRRTLWKEIVPGDLSGATIGRILLTPDGRSYVYALHRDLSKLYLVDGLK